MPVKSLLLSCCAAAAALVAPAAQATNFVVDVVLDPTTFAPNGTNQIALTDPLTIAVGDTVDLKISFTGGATFSLANAGMLWTGLFADTIGSVTSSGTLSFIGGSSNLMTTPTVEQTNIYAHAGNQYGTSDYLAGSGPISFTGIEQVYTILSNDAFTMDGVDYPAGPNPRIYNAAFFYYEGAASSSAAPEPASWALMLGGFGAIGGAMRRRTAALRLA